MPRASSSSATSNETRDRSAASDGSAASSWATPSSPAAGSSSKAMTLTSTATLPPSLSAGAAVVDGPFPLERLLAWPFAWAPPPELLRLRVKRDGPPEPAVSAVAVSAEWRSMGLLGSEAAPPEDGFGVAAEAASTSTALSTAPRGKGCMAMSSERSFAIACSTSSHRRLWWWCSSRFRAVRSLTFRSWTIESERQCWSFRTCSCCTACSAWSRLS
mmetsp:Transcript_11393/g.32613  ORF Transcript_11393/g.32613 Transcript_11393/m.32613 type:complete len:216 (-) Transcript_11393:313-960(-)